MLPTAAQHAAMTLPPPAPGFMAPPSFQVALDWTEEEQRALEAGLQRYPPEHFDLVQRYVKIAAMLPRKSVRDVALRARWTINQQLLKKRKPGELPPGAAAAGAKKPLGAPGGLLPPKVPQIPPVPMVSLAGLAGPGLLVFRQRWQARQASSSAARGEGRHCPTCRAGGMRSRAGLPGLRARGG